MTSFDAPSISVAKERRTGRFTATAYFGVVDGKPKRLRRSAQTRGEARAKLDFALREAGYLAKSAAHVSLHQLLADFGERIPVRWKNELTRNKKEIALRWLRANFEDEYLGALTPGTIERILDASSLAPSTQVAYLLVLRDAIDFARREYFSLEVPNPAAEVRIANATQRVRQPRYLSADEYDALIQAAKGFLLYEMVLVASQLALRPGEVVGLRWRHVSLESKTITIAESMKFDTRGAPSHIGEIKTGSIGQGVRTLIPREEVLDALLEHRNRGLVCAPQWPDLVFPTSKGTPYQLSNFRRELKEIVDASKIGGQMAPYDLRHSACMRWVEAGVPLDYIADLMGHETVRMAREVYSRRRTVPLDATR